MRIISGVLKGTVIKTPQGLDLRPTTDFAKRPLKPLPKGKYRPPNVPDLPQMMRSRTTQATHAERIRLFAEIQVISILK